MTLPVVDLTDRPNRVSGVEVERVGTLARMTLPCGAVAMLTDEQALQVAGDLIRVRNEVRRAVPGGAS